MKYQPTYTHEDELKNPVSAAKIISLYRFNRYYSTQSSYEPNLYYNLNTSRFLLKLFKRDHADIYLMKIFNHYE